MRYLGIDYGHKKIGLALSDEQGDFVYPYKVISNNDNTVKMISKICSAEGVKEIVIGESRDLKGQPNVVFAGAKVLGDRLAKCFPNKSIYFHNETYTSREAARVIGQDKELDARAAALMLESFLASRRKKSP